MNALLMLLAMALADDWTTVAGTEPRRRERREGSADDVERGRGRGLEAAAARPAGSTPVVAKDRSS
jgi:hypothetical protein